MIMIITFLCLLFEWFAGIDMETIGSPGRKELMLLIK